MSEHWLPYITALFIILNYVSKHVTYDCSFVSFKKAFKHWIVLDTSHVINDNLN